MSKKAGTADQIRAALVSVVDAWESLPGGRRYPAREIEDWLIDQMKPALDRARRALGRKIPTRCRHCHGTGSTPTGTTYGGQSEEIECDYCAGTGSTT